MLFIRNESWSGIKLWYSPWRDSTRLWPFVTLQLLNNIRGSGGSEAKSSHLSPGLAEMRSASSYGGSYWRSLCEWLPCLSLCGHPRVSVGQTEYGCRARCSPAASDQLAGWAAIKASGVHGLMLNISSGLKLLSSFKDIYYVKTQTQINNCCTD